jgi:hypothetical protein
MDEAIEEMQEEMKCPIPNRDEETVRRSYRRPKIWSKGHRRRCRFNARGERKRKQAEPEEVVVDCKSTRDEVVVPVVLKQRQDKFKVSSNADTCISLHCRLVILNNDNNALAFFTTKKDWCFCFRYMITPAADNKTKCIV